METQYDVIVVGAGNAGLAAAANTAKAGLKTLVLEKHNLPGGCATSFRRGRFEFEPSLHELCSVGSAEKPSLIYKFFDDLGAKPEWCYEKELFRSIVKGKNGFDITTKAGLESFCQSIDDAVPGCKETVRAFLELMLKIDAAISYVDKKQGKPNRIKMVLKYGDFLRAASHSTEAVMTALGIPQKAQDIINTYWSYLGVPTDELNAMHFLNMIHGYVVDLPAMPRHRSHELSLSLADVILKNGGEIWYNSEVTEFLYHPDGSAAGVVANGKKLFAKEIVSNVIPHNVYRMSDPDKIPERQVKLANARSMGISMIAAYIGLDCTAEELGISDYTVFIAGDPDPRVQFNTRKDFGLYIVNCLNNVIPDCTPEGTSTLFLTIPLLGQDMPETLQPQDYKKYKNDIVRRYLEDAEAVLGIDIFSHIEEISIATPATFANYIGTPQGTVYGYTLSGWDNLLVRTTCEQEDFTIPGLHFCGAHHVRGDGYSSTYLMGDIAGKRVISKLKGGA